jgi:peptidoglycan/xylan/chitin deacetylase (PgdA/CDA1 family)
MGTRGRRLTVLVCAAALTGSCASPGTRPSLDAPIAPARTPAATRHGQTVATPSPRSSQSPRSTQSPRTSQSTRSPHSTRSPQSPPSPRFAGPADSQMRTRGNAVALTFDDGPDPVQTPKILDLLARYHVTATFCLIGVNVQAHPKLVRRIVAEGHTLCNHTWRHSLTLGRQPASAIRADLRRTNDAIRRAAPGATIKYTRAPGGNFTPAYVTVAAGMGMTSLYWQVDPRDWDHPAGESSAAHRARVVAAVQKQVRKGSIVLSHDAGQPDTIAAYRTLLPWLKHRYQLTPSP